MKKTKKQLQKKEKKTKKQFEYIKNLVISNVLIEYNQYELFDKIKDYLKYKNKDENRIISLSELCLVLGISNTSLHFYRKKYKKINQICNKIKMMQEVQLINNGLSGKFNSNIAKLLLLSQHGYSENNENNQYIDNRTVHITLQNKTEEELNEKLQSLILHTDDNNE